jgi:DeoR/GlpR family transcriptional regulator of sugar metabolism
MTTAPAQMKRRTLETQKMSAGLPPERRLEAAERKGALLAEPRRMKILAWLQEEGSVRVKALSAAFGVTEATIRQDLEKLENDGQVVREHGGAFLKSLPQQVQTMTLQNSTHMDAKRKIGKAAAALVSHGETVILDAGTTTTEVAHCLKDRREMTVITNALNIALMLGAEPTFSVHMPGGQFKAPTLSLTGEKSADYFSNIFVDTLFLATGGMSLEAGLTYPSLADIPIKAAMIRSATRVVLVADSSKMHRVSFSSLGAFDLVDVLVTDEGLKQPDQAAIEALGVQVVIST